MSIEAFDAAAGTEPAYWSIWIPARWCWSRTSGSARTARSRSSLRSSPGRPCSRPTPPASPVQSSAAARGSPAARHRLRRRQSLAINGSFPSQFVETAGRRDARAVLLRQRRDDGLRGRTPPARCGRLTADDLYPCSAVRPPRTVTVHRCGRTGTGRAFDGTDTRWCCASQRRAPHRPPTRPSLYRSLAGGEYLRAVRDVAYAVDERGWLRQTAPTTAPSSRTPRRAMPSQPTPRAAGWTVAGQGALVYGFDVDLGNTLVRGGVRRFGILASRVRCDRRVTARRRGRRRGRHPGRQDRRRGSRAVGVRRHLATSSMLLSDIFLGPAGS